MGCGHSDRGSAESRSTASTVVGPSDRRRRRDEDWPDGTLQHGGGSRDAGDRYNNSYYSCSNSCYGLAGLRRQAAAVGAADRPWTNAGFPVHRITRVMQVEQVDVCEEQINKIFTNSLQDDYANQKGFPEVLSVHGSWIYGLNAGGSRNNLDLFETNPQYLLKFPSKLVEEHLFITIKIILKVKRLNKKKPLHVAFFLYKNDFQQKETLGAEYFLCTEPEGSSGTFKAKQVVFETFVVSTLASYVIVPATFRPFQQGEFVIKVMVDRKLGTELKKLTPPTRPSVGNINIQ